MTELYHGKKPGASIYERPFVEATAPQIIVDAYTIANKLLPQRHGAIKSAIMSSAIAFCGNDFRKWQQIIAAPLSDAQCVTIFPVFNGGHMSVGYGYFSDSYAARPHILDKLPVETTEVRTIDNSGLNNHYQTFIKQSIRELHSIIRFVKDGYFPEGDVVLERHLAEIADFFTPHNGQLTSEATIIKALIAIPFEVINHPANEHLIEQYHHSLSKRLSAFTLNRYGEYNHVTKKRVLTTLYQQMIGKTESYFHVRGKYTDDVADISIFQAEEIIHHMFRPENKR